MIQRLRLFLFLLLFTLVSFLLFRHVLFSVVGWHDGLNLDWYNVYYPASAVNNPYSIYGYFNPPWLAWLLRPFSLLSPADGHVLWMVIMLLLTVRCVYALGGGWFGAVLTVVSPGFLVAIINGQVDVLVLLGLVVNWWLLITVKPQVASLAVVYSVVKGRGVDRVALVVVPAVFLFFHPPSLTTLTWGANISLWPWGAPVGLFLFLLSLVRRDRYMAALATFFFAPYISGSSLMVYSAIACSRYGRFVAVLFSALLWGLYLPWFR